jgi:hypothetical protein
MMKVCTKKDCSFDGKPQPLTSFYKHSACADGHQSICKTCNHQYKPKKAKQSLDWLSIIIGEPLKTNDHERLFF